MDYVKWRNDDVIMAIKWIFKVCFPKLKPKTEYQLKVVAQKDTLMSTAINIDVETLDDDIEWKKRWYNWR